MGAITSEGGPHFHKELILEWIADNGEVGYFVRDEGSPFDCLPMMPTVFAEIYFFRYPDEGTLFREIVQM